MTRLTTLLVALAGVLAAAALAAPTPAAAAPPPLCRAVLSLRAVGDRTSTDLALALVRRQTGCRMPAALHDVRVVGAGRRVRLVASLRFRGGRAQLVLPALPRHGRVTVRAVSGTAQVLSRTRVLRRPDLSVRLVAPPSARAGVPFTVRADVSEVGHDLGATAVLAVGPEGAPTTQSVSVRAGQTLRLSIPVTLAASGTVTAQLTGATPADGNPANDAATATVAIVDFAVGQTPLLTSIAGFGAQLNQNVYAAISQDIGVTADNVRQMEDDVVALQPQLVRIFFNKAAFTNTDLMQSFVRTAELAQRSGATIDVTWQSTYGPSPTGDMGQFAKVLADLVRTDGVTNLRWVSAQNEVNGTKLTMDTYAAMVRALDAALRTAGLRQQIGIMGGDLVGSVSPRGESQSAWLTFLATQLGDVVDAFGVHIYWDYWDTAKLERRLTDVRALVDALPATARKPLYVTEYGVRGHPSATTLGGVLDDGTPFQASNVHAFQLAWFNVLATRLGYSGTIKWDAFIAKYDNTLQDYSLIGSPTDGWPLRPAYQALRLMTQVTHPGWSTLTVDGPPDGRLVTAFRGPAGELSIIGLDRDGGQLNTASATQVSYVVGGLPPGKAFHLLVWNAAGDGATADGGAVTADATGTATVTAPLQSVFALTGA